MAAPTFSRFVRALVGLASAGFIVASSEPARADVSSWVFVGAGPSAVDDGDTGGWEMQPYLRLETGMGTPPTTPFVLGGMFKLGTHFARGTDLGLSLRTATQGFVLGEWGVALDLGGYQRFWETGSSGGEGSLVLGGPWGLTLSLTGGLGTNDARHASAVLGIDFARLTVHRTSGQSWFMNPYPAPQPGN